MMSSDDTQYMVTLGNEPTVSCCACGKAIEEFACVCTECTKGFHWEWVSIKDRFPENKEVVLVLDEHGEMTVCECKIYESNNQYIFMLNQTSLQIKNIKYWMSLPDAPK